MAKDPRCLDVSVKVCLEELGLLILAIPMLYIYVITPQYNPVQRGFFCDDESLKHPYTERQMVSTGALIGIWLSLATSIIVFVETLRSAAESPQKYRHPIRGTNIPWLAVELYRQLGHFIFGRDQRIK